jgi:hypothetical protein
MTAPQPTEAWLLANKRIVFLAAGLGAQTPSLAGLPIVYAFFLAESGRGRD